MTIKVIDIETTGVDHEHDKVIEIGSVDIVDRKAANPVHTLVNPGIPIPPEASAIHHLLDRDVAKAPAFDGAIQQFEGAQIYVAHNAKFEAEFLPMLSPWICTYKCALRLWPDAPRHSNQVLRYWRGLADIELLGPHDMPHRALPDAVVTAELFIEMAAEVGIKQMREWSAIPALLPKVQFGKHYGKTWAELPANYLRWIVGQDFDEDVLFTANYHLNGGE